MISTYNKKFLKIYKFFKTNLFPLTITFSPTYKGLTQTVNEITMDQITV